MLRMWLRSGVGLFVVGRGWGGMRDGGSVWRGCRWGGAGSRCMLWVRVALRSRGRMLCVMGVGVGKGRVRCVLRLLRSGMRLGWRWRGILGCLRRRGEDGL